MATAPSTNARPVMIVLVAVSLALLLVIMQPFASALLLAAVLASVTQPVHSWLTKRLRGRTRTSATLMTFGIVVLLLIPLAVVASVVVSEAANTGKFIVDTVKGHGVQALIERLPGFAQRLFARLGGSIPNLEQQLNERISAQGGTAAKAVGGAVLATGTALVQALFMLIAFYFLLVDGRRLIEWLERVSPLPLGQTTELLNEFKLASAAVVKGNLGTSAVQAVVAGVGYLIARVPHPLFFAVITFFVAFVPTVGAGGTVFVAALLILATGHPWAALFLALWGMFVVGLVDNLVKPWLIKGGMRMHGAIVFFALLGGLAIFGPIGLLAGPLIVVFFATVVRIYRRDYAKPRREPLVTPSGERATDVVAPPPLVEHPQ